MKHSFKKTCTSIALSILAIFISACGGTLPSLGGSEGNGSVVTGSAAGGSQVDKNDALERCDASLGTVSVFEDRQDPWWNNFSSRYPRLGSTVPVIRLMIQQSNCFVVVERGRSMAAMTKERELMQSGELRGGSNFGGGQMVAADFTLTPSVLFAEKGTGGIGGAIAGSLFGGLGKLAAGALSKNEAETNLTLIENRSGVQVSASVGSAKNYDSKFVAGLFGGAGAVGVGGYSRTPEGKIVSAAFADSYNQMVRSLKEYKAQTVKGGLGKGGRLAIGGADDKMPEATPLAKVAPAVVATAEPVKVEANEPTVSTYKSNISLDEIDEDAMKDYYDALKGSVEHLGTFASFTAEQVEAMKNDPKMKGMAGFALNMIWGGPWVNKLETAQIELESWPDSAKKEAWKVYGKRINKYNKIFYQHRDTMLANKAFDKTVLDRIANVELITEDSLFAQ